MTDLADLEGALANLREHQQQLDADGIMVGVSRQALDIVLREAIKARQALADLLDSETHIEDEELGVAFHAEMKKQGAFTIEKFGKIALAEAPFIELVLAAIRSRASEDKR